MPILLVIGAIIGFVVAAIAMLNLATDIQIIVALVGFFGGLLSLGQLAILRRFDSSPNGKP